MDNCVTFVYHDLVAWLFVGFVRDLLDELPVLHYPRIVELFAAGEYFDFVVGVNFESADVGSVGL